MGDIIADRVDAEEEVGRLPIPTEVVQYVLVEVPTNLPDAGRKELEVDLAGKLRDTVRPMIQRFRDPVEVRWSPGSPVRAQYVPVDNIHGTSVDHYRVTWSSVSHVRMSIHEGDEPFVCGGADADVDLTELGIDCPPFAAGLISKGRLSARTLNETIRVSHNGMLLDPQFRETGAEGTLVVRYGSREWMVAFHVDSVGVRTRELARERFYVLIREDGRIWEKSYWARDHGSAEALRELLKKQDGVVHDLGLGDRGIQRGTVMAQPDSGPAAETLSVPQMDPSVPSEFTDRVVFKTPVLAAMEWDHPNRKRTLESLRAIAEALDELHGHQFVHGDVKPDNVRRAPRAGGGFSEAILVDTETLAGYGDWNRFHGLSGCTPKYLHPSDRRAGGSSDEDFHARRASDRWGFIALVLRSIGGAELEDEMIGARGLGGDLRPVISELVKAANSDLAGDRVTALSEAINEALTQDGASVAATEWECTGFVDGVLAAFGDTGSKSSQPDRPDGLTSLLLDAANKPHPSRAATDVDEALRNLCLRARIQYFLISFVASFSVFAWISWEVFS